MKLEKQREELAEASHRLAVNGLVIGTSGNLSMRQGDLVALTPTGGTLATLTPEMMTVVDMEGQIVDGDLAPTSELAMHLGIYANTTSTAIAHAHSMASTTVACTHKELPPIHYTILSLGGTIRVAPYRDLRLGRAGSQRHRGPGGQERGAHGEPRLHRPHVHHGRSL